MKPGVLISLTVSVMLASVSVRAEAPAPFPDFTFKRISPPKPGQKRITVQIDPAEQQAALKKPVVANVPVEAKPVAGRFGWFWETVSPDAAQGNADRLETALAALGKPPKGQAVTAPRLNDMLPIVRAQGAAMLLNTIGTKVSPALVLAVISVESAGRADAISSAGAEGLMQLIPATAERFGVDDSLNAGENIRGGVAYLDWLLGEFDGDPILALAAYNAGEGAVRDHGGVPPYAETRDYVPKVLAAYSVARGLCKTPPLLISDGCVFVTAN
ncbi:Soluble lytic murein transglycosylase precursor [Thalassovita gelatinovora]|uniref:Soluble lytic murein transglycosylase n=1 Tax=Thalassovita gelatinovora TaxID=53501 RepID=A0A0P1F8G4_THAGE|nr:lytic transglycosylase domain-containing protein [Thalassovita gelatinovora]QIZ80306.1 transglycosylase SLT domain-containing protein [Thalassovita gelatinovora]CUH64212.1 Soluble lytic murein transglycosylase precursor [Thalassovita gelatinovora]SEQ85539.1 Transglycosylase SLT domain-containing protein [Thalassovita gelatinovora]